MDRGFMSFGGVEVRNPGIAGVQSRIIPSRFTQRFMSGGLPPDSVGFGAQSGGPAPGQGTPSAMDSGNGGEHPAGGNPLMVWIGMVILLVALHFVRRNASALQANLISVNVFNLLVITVTAVVGITLFKMLFTKFMVPGVSPLVAAV